MTRLKLRSVDTHFWSDSYIQTLKPSQKLLFLYLITTPFNNLAGVYEITMETIRFHTGLTATEIKAILKKFEADGKVKYYAGYVILKNFLRHQTYNSSMLVNVHRTIEGLPKDVADTANDFLKDGSKAGCVQDGYTPPPPSVQDESESKDEGKEKVEVKRKEFYDSVFSEDNVNKYKARMLQSFFDYWSEMTRGRSKMRYELQPTWELGMRLATWKRNEDKFNKSDEFHASDF